MAQFGSASALGAEGRRFESGHPDHMVIGPACIRRGFFPSGSGMCDRSEVAGSIMPGPTGTPSANLTAGHRRTSEGPGKGPRAAPDRLPGDPRRRDPPCGRHGCLWYR